MPGLLDMFANPEATAQLGAGLLSGNFGAGATGYFQAINTQRQNALKEQMLKAQLGEIAAQTQQRQAEASKQMAALQQQQKVQQLLQSFGQVPKGMGATDQVNSALPAEMQIGAQPALRPNNDYASLIKGGVPTELVKALAESRNYGRDEVARTEETTDAQGRPIKRQYTKFGDSVGGDMPQWKAPVSVNQGNKTTFVDPVSMRQAGSFQTFQSPESVASTALGWANNAATLRGQNMTDARTRETLAQGKMQYDADRGGIVDMRSGEFRPAMQNGQAIGAKDKDLTDSQAKALLFSTRMAAADKTLGELAQSGVTTSIPGASAGFGIGGAINVVSPAKQQQLQQAKRDFINAILRRESGAVISPSEFENGDKQYFPQIGDAPEVIAQKAANRQLATQAIQAEVPERKRSFGQSQQAKPPTPMKGMVQNGYRYKGGDPGDQNNWEKQ